MIHISLQNGVSSPIRRLHGVNLAAPIVNASLSRLLSQELGRLRIPLTRLHDAPLDNPGMRLVDIPCVFPNPHADPDDPANYYFDQTDDYIRNAHDYGTRIMYRLGVSIEHSARHYWTKPPADPDRWVRICLRVVEHYPDIEYWEIGNEADEEIPQLWDGTWRQFIELYARTARAIKARFPHVKVGGPSMARLHNHEGRYVREFLAACRDEQAPLDFFSWHQYSDKPRKIIASPFEARALLDEYGFSAAELHLTEWHYHPGWGSDCTPQRQKRVHEAMLGIDAAAYLGAVLAGWQDTPITMGHYYTASTMGGSGYAMFDPVGLRTAGYHVMEQFNLLTEQQRGVSAVSSDENTWVLAAATDRRLFVWICAFKTPQDEITVNVEPATLHPPACRVTMLDGPGGPGGPCVLDRDLTWQDHQLRFEKSSGSAVILLELETR